MLITKIFQKQLEKVFKKYSVAFAYLFGSHAKNENNSSSDIDIAVYLYNQKQHVSKGKLGWGIETELTTDLMEVFGSDEIDLVILNTCNSEVLKYNILLHGKIIYVDNQDIYMKNEIKMIMESKDFMEKHYSQYLNV